MHDAWVVRAVVREISARFSEALAAQPQPIDVDLARRQHAAYREALAACGARVIVVPGDPRYPDCCFVEDTAVVVGDRALLTRPGAPSRRGEVDAIALALRDAGLAVVQLAEPATLDGGDCLRLGDTLYVGRSARTNAAGIAGLADAFPTLRVVALDLPANTLHLKCVVSALDDERVVLAAGTFDPATFGAGTIVIPADETYAANCVALGHHAIVADGFPATRAAIERAGWTVHAVPTSEVRKADGSLTCQSIVLR